MQLGGDAWLEDDEGSVAVGLGTVLLETPPAPNPPPIRHGSVVETRKVRPYYEVLSECPQFRQALGWLLHNWTWTDADRFVRWFRLPKDAMKDLAWTHDLWKRGLVQSTKLHVGMRTYPGLECPVTWGQAKELGYRQDPPRLKDPNSLRRGALRLYRRAVLGCSWQKIAEEEIDAYEQYPEANTVKGQTKDWAAGLGVTLPDRPAGRPRGSRPAMPLSRFGINWTLQA